MGHETLFFNRRHYYSRSVTYYHSILPFRKIAQTLLVYLLELELDRLQNSTIPVGLGIVETFAQPHICAELATAPATGRKDTYVCSPRQFPG